MNTLNEIGEYLDKNSKTCESHLKTILLEYEKELVDTEPGEELLLVLEDVEVLGLCVNYVSIYDDGEFSSDQVELQKEVKDFFRTPEFAPIDLLYAKRSDEEHEELINMAIKWLKTIWVKVIENHGAKHDLYFCDHFTNNQGLSLLSDEVRVFYD